MIAINNLRKIYKDPKQGDVVAVNKVNFIAKPGKITGLLGPNGAGKTTTLRIIATILSPTEGDVFVDGINALQQPEEVRQRIGFLTGTTGLYPFLTVKETITFFGKINGLADGILKSRIDELTQIFDMGNFLNRRIENLSTGMRQKVSIARTIIHDPQILILDEPMSGLDILTSKSIRNFIKYSCAQGKSILFSTHVMREVELLCDEIIIIHQGQVLEQGSLDELRLKTDKYNLEDVFLKFIGEYNEN